MATKPKKEEKAQPAPGEQPATKPEQTSGNNENLDNRCSLKQTAPAPNRRSIVIQLTCCLLQTPRYAGEFYQPERRAGIIAKAVELADEIIAATAS